MFRALLESRFGGDPAHDISHFVRVARTAQRLCESERAAWSIVEPAAWLHDFVVVAKDDPRRSQASRLSAEEACAWLRSIGTSEELLPAIAHAIEAHSFSAGIEPRTIEARVVQDADRLDGLGAIGLARLFVTAGLLRRPLYAPEDPFCFVRTPDDSRWTIDHVYKKLAVVAQTLQTEAGRAEGARRISIIERYLEDLRLEIES